MWFLEHNNKTSATRVYKNSEENGSYGIEIIELYIERKFISIFFVKLPVLDKSFFIIFNLKKTVQEHHFKHYLTQ